MAKIGKWGSVIKFSVNSEKQLTFRNMKLTNSGRWKTHNIIGKRPKTEFLGPGLSEVTMDIVLDAEMGVKPRAMIKKIRAACISGEVHYLYLDGKKVGKLKKAITSVSESWDQVWSKGELKRAVVSVTFSEYR